MMAKIPEIFFGMAPILSDLSLSFISPAFPKVATLENLRCFNNPEKRVDFTGYPSNHFPGCRLDGQMLAIVGGYNNS